MPESRKTIPIAVVPATKDADTEIGSCAELEPFALRVVGDSMAPEFLDGHVIILDPGLPATHGAFVVLEHEGETHFGQFHVEAGKKLLKPLNSTYPVLAVARNDRILGVVTQRSGARRRDSKRY
jgi:SOS-response transcriptional repressor LexA